VQLPQVAAGGHADDPFEVPGQVVNDSGEAWLSGTTAGGRRATRLSVSNWQTSRADIARALAAFRDAACQVSAPG
jgi:hypothetical protein